MQYKDYSVRDFIQDEYFQNWVFHHDEGVNTFWESWLANHPHKRTEVEQARLMLQGIHFDSHTLASDEVSELWNGIVLAGNIAGKSSHGRSSLGRSHKWRWFSGIAAAFLMAAIAGIYFYNQRGPWKQFHTLYGETRTVKLPDGSAVVLNANSTLTLYADWNEADAREIWLDGEAFFSVTHQPNNLPFKVNTREGVTVEVLGTTFNVYNRINGTKVILNSGQIRLNLPLAEASELVVMKPGEMVEYKSKQYHKTEVNPELYTAWTNNKIILDHTSLEEMVYMLRDTYGLQISAVDPALLRQTVSGSMPLGDAEVLLQQLAKAFQLKIERQGNLITIREHNNTNRQ